MDVDSIKVWLTSNLTYDPKTGELRWLNDRAGGKVKAGSLAGSINKGYRQIRIEGKWYKCHRLVWLIENGAWPKDQIDHMDGNKLNNKISNLRDVSNYVNCLNRGRLSSSGYIGVTYDRVNDKWLAQTYRKGKAMNLGRYETPEEASKVYKAYNKKRA